MRRNCLLALGALGGPGAGFAGWAGDWYNWRGPWRPATPRARLPDKFDIDPNLFRRCILVFILQLNIYSRRGRAERMLGNHFESSGKL